MADADDGLAKSVESLIAEKEAVAARAATPVRKPGRPVGSGKTQAKPV